jgi:adenosylcobyric acid synthase
MLQGTSSDAGKSLLVAGLCRLLTNRGLRVRPFKPQNMSNNAAVTPDGGEIGRAQALQAQACRVAPSRDMNPVLLKPERTNSAQIVVQGRVVATCSARAYHEMKPSLLPAVLSCFRRLAEAADIVLVEGAGSPAEINLRAGDIANMGFAMAAGVPVVLIGDIERGGVLASITGTMALLAPAEQTVIGGYVVNKFRGDPRLFDSALPILRQRTGLPCLGVVPWFEAATLLPQEDILGLRSRPRASPSTRLRIAVPHLPRIANFEDLDPLAQEPDTELRVLQPGQVLPGDTDLVLLPGSKATIADLAAFRATGWDIDILAHVRRGGWVVGLCGGFQMLGKSIADPGGMEGPPETVPGLGLLDVTTELTSDKLVRAVQGREVTSGLPVHGYEIHLGRTHGPDSAQPWMELAGAPDGAIGTSGRVLGCHLHGLFAADGFRHSFLNRIRERTASSLCYEAGLERTLDELASHLERCLAVDSILSLTRPVQGVQMVS